MPVKLSAQIQNYKKLLASLDGIKAGSEKAVRDTVKDMKARAPGWIASAVTGTYNIKKSEVTPASGNAAKPQKKAGGVTARGDTLESLEFVYRGRLLTPTHFGMRPASRPAGAPAAEGKKARPAKPYSVTAEIFKGSRKPLGSRVFLGGNNGGAQVPFQRKGGARLPIQAVKTLSLPQMVGNEKVAEGIQEKLGEGLAARLEHNINRQLGI